MSLVRRLSLRSVLNARRYRSSYPCHILLHSRRDDDEQTTHKSPEIRSYHGFIHHRGSLTSGCSGLDRNRSPFQSPAIASDRTISTFSFSGTSGTVEILADWVLKSAVSNVHALHNVADALASLQHLIALLHSLTFSQWWVCIIVTSLLIRGVTIPVMIDWLNNIAKFFNSLGSHHASAQGEVLDKVSLLSKSRSVMYTMLEKEFLGVKGTIFGKSVQVPIFWLSVEELKQNMAGILVSCLRGKTFSAELIKNGVLSKGRLVVVVGDGFGLEIQMFDLDFSLILKRREDQKEVHKHYQ
ncbi:unnamed protein product [Microthlaspi erraticum]|uniref:Uncharacterized protein n=1 Tax=Microthlaspi erraticum TaxID=1685480 RepID=A0A6D2IEP4_9BRAS|nr:unnamed protein product [Microthlaspi erraticum]